MREATGNLSSFPIARCEACGKTVLLYLAYGADGQQQRLCVHCDGSIDSALAWVTAEELEAEGYAIGAPPAKRGGGCGCGSGGGCTRGR